MLKLLLFLLNQIKILGFYPNLQVKELFIFFVCGIISTSKINCLA
jgi:hypothetical protein